MVRVIAEVATSGEKTAAGVEADLPPVSGLASVDLACSISGIPLCSSAGDNLRESSAHATPSMTDSVESHFVVARATSSAGPGGFRGNSSARIKKSPAKQLA